MGARERWAWATIWTMRASIVSAPTLAARMTKLPRPLSVPPMTSAPAAFSTGSDSPVTMLSSTALAPSTTSPSTGHAVAGADAQQVAGMDGVEGDLLVAAVGAHPARGLGRQVRAGP